MNNFTYSIPTKIHFGKGQISHLSELSESGNKVLLCYGGGSIKKAGIYDEAVKILKEEDMEIFELSGIAPNPKIESVREGVKLCKENSIDMGSGYYTKMDQESIANFQCPDIISHRIRDG